MFFQILFFPIVLVIVYLLPYLGVTFSVKNHKKWLGHWLITLLLVNFVSCVLSLVLQDWMVQFFCVALGVALLLKNDNDITDQLFGLVDSGVQLVKAQSEMIKQKISGQMRQQGLIQ